MKGKGLSLGEGEGTNVIRCTITARLLEVLERGGGGLLGHLDEDVVADAVC